LKNSDRDSISLTSQTIHILTKFRSKQI
jgi:hypothetical protein